MWLRADVSPINKRSTFDQEVQEGLVLRQIQSSRATASCIDHHRNKHRSMRGVTITALAGLASLVSTQSIDLDYANSLPDPTYTVVPDQRAQTVTYNQATAIASVVAEAMQSPVPDPGESAIRARDIPIEKRGAPCAALNNNANTYRAVLDPAESFLSDGNLADQALNALTPSGYTRVYQNLKKSAQANGYMG